MLTRAIYLCESMIRAVLTGRKTILFLPCEMVYDGETGVGAGWEPDPTKGWGRLRKGDILWIKESWVRIPAWYYPLGKVDKYDPDYSIHYKADGPNVLFNWKPSITLPMYNARLFLQVQSAYPILAQEITREDLVSAGVHYYDAENGWFWEDLHPLDLDFETDTRYAIDCYSSPMGAFANYWRRAHGYNLGKDEYVVRVEFTLDRKDQDGNGIH